MADQSDVESVLVGLVAAALYPNGPTEPSVPGPDCRIYRGWPQSAALDADLSAGKINVTVFPSGDPGRVTSRYSQEWFITQTSTPGLTITVDGNTVTLGGTADPGQLAGILVNDQTYVYRTQEGDSAELVAANLATLARADQIVLLSGATLTIPGAAKVVGRVVADVPVLQEVRRQEQTLRITCWCPTPATRDSAASVIDQSL
ncbi:MAG: hypothetical protein JO227_17850, partial [Acetobacteraceae bacterium]|nr:hypothetical protein [Acetobacteraceae bacterium]